MKLNLYIQDNCPHCEALEIPEGLNINKIDINGDYSGFRPDQVPVIQINGLNLVGPHGINSILKTLKQAQDGDYKG